MEKINTIIVEDSASNRETLIKLLEQECPNVSVIGEAPTLDVAAKMIKELNPNLVLLDIQMKKGTTFDLLEKLYAEDSINFEIIFITAFGMFEYATNAIEYAALDFITKPVDPQLLKKAISKASSKINKQEQSSQIALLLENLSKPNVKSKRMAVHLTKGIIEFVEMKEIIWLEADGTITYFYLEDGKKLTAMKNLGFYSKLLVSDYDFFQISNSILINLDFVKRYNHSELTVSLTNGKHLFASRRGGQDFKKYLSEDQVNSNKLSSSKLTEFFKRILG